VRRHETFVSEVITPVSGTMDIRRMAIGEPGLPGRFVWRRREVEIVRVLEQWKEHDPAAGGEERYLRKHWYRVLTAEGDEMKLYFHRQPKSHRRHARRWYLYTVSRSANA
jgi:hypothetical protein